jgi:MinD superfamily P-loop ATPase
LLHVGDPLAVPVISALKRWKPPFLPALEVIDCPPGASCPVVESIRGADFVLLVTEPTPFGFHDLRQAYQVTQILGVPAGVIINRDGMDPAGIGDFCQNHHLPLFMRIPLDQRIAAETARGRLLIDIDPPLQKQFTSLFEEIQTGMRRREIP